MKGSSSVYYRKFQLALLVSVAILAISYKLVFKRTFEEMATNKELNEKIRVGESVREKVKFLEQRFESENLGGNNNGKSEAGNDETVLDLISNYSRSNPIRLLELPAEVIVERDGLLMSTCEIVLQGSFRELLLILSFLEKQEYAGKVSSAEFYLQPDRTSGTSFLRLKLFIVNLKQK